MRETGMTSSNDIRVCGFCSTKVPQLFLKLFCIDQSCIGNLSFVFVFFLFFLSIAVICTALFDISTPFDLVFLSNLIINVIHGLGLHDIGKICDVE